MAAETFSTILFWVIANGYLMIFAAVIVGGPIFVSAAAFAAALGYFNIYVIFSLAFFGEMAVDIFLFFTGKILRENILIKLARYLGWSQPGLLRLERLLLKHAWKALLIIKYSPIIPISGFITAGAARLPFKKFIYILLVLSAPKALVFTIIGYYFGLGYNRYAKYFYYGQYLIVVAVVALIIINYLFFKFTKKLSEEET